VGYERVAERSATGALVKLFYPQGVWIAATSQAYLYSSDHLGSVRDLYTPAGTVVASYDYDPYGQLSVLGSETVKSDFGFTGHWRHNVAGQSFLWLAPLRAYDPTMGRWLSRDPVGEAGGLDLHGYVGNNPTSVVDPLGLCYGSSQRGGIFDAGHYRDQSGKVRDSSGQVVDPGSLGALSSSSRGGGTQPAAKTLPEVKFSAAKYPELAENILHAQKAGHPSVLTHGGNSAANRAAALDGVPNLRPLSRDEYPFASSMEGGARSWVGHIPVSQQNAQGAILKNFFRKNNIKPGDQYRVVVIP
ncbi:MAG: hypothetical protein EOP09_03895, partial [Proteobacteria bacterium]